MQRWESIEAILPKYRDQNEKNKLSHHMKVLTFVVMMSSLGKIQWFSKFDKISHLSRMFAIILQLSTS